MFVRCVRALVPKYFARDDGLKRGIVGSHRPDLPGDVCVLSRFPLSNQRCLAYPALGDPLNVECFKIEKVSFDFGRVQQVKAHSTKHVFDVIRDLSQMERTDAGTVCWKRGIEC